MAIKDWPGGVISKTPVVPAGTNANSAASGVWTLDQVAYWQKQGIWPNPANITDPYYEYVTLLLTGDGTNGAQNNTFLDSSTNNFTITRNGNTTQGTFSPYGNLWSSYLYDAYITASLGAAGQFGTGDFTVECWINPSAGSQTTGNVIWTFGLYPANNGIYLAYSNDGTIFVWSGGASAISVSAGITLNVWQHVAVTRSGTSLRLFVNGNQIGSASSSTNFTDGFQYIGRPNDVASYYFRGYISNFRAVKGTALYTSNFTPSTTPLTAVSGTSLLTCQSNRFIDNSSNNFTLTVNGDTKVQRFSPFNPTAPYSAATIGGSGYFDGSGDWLSLASNSAFSLDGDFCVEMWVYPFSVSGAPHIFSTGTSSGNLTLYISSGTFQFVMQAVSGFGTTSTLNANAWNHVAATRSGTLVRLFINGVQGASATYSGTFTQNGAFIGSNPGGANIFTGGYIDDVRLVKGSAVYTSNFTPPTAPLTAITNTSLLCNFTNAGIPDAAMMNDLETVGNAQVSTSVKKYGTGSLYFDGTGDYLSIPNSPQLDYGSGNFTIEFWVYFNATANQPILFKRSNVLADAYASVLISTNGSSKMAYEFANSAGNGWAAQIIGTTTMSTGQWYHVAVVRNGTAATCYVNGATDASTTLTSSIFNNSQTMTIGYDKYTGGFFNGYIDDLRITKGYARYTSSFTPPTQAFPTF